MSKKLEATYESVSLPETVAIRFAQGRGMTGPPWRILVVEDDAFVRELYSDVLTAAGYAVDSAGDGEEGWQKLQCDGSAVPFDLVITDNKMPILSGIGLISRLQASHIRIPIILASATIPNELPELHLTATLCKPFLPDQLTKTVGAILDSGDD